MTAPKTRLLSNAIFLASSVDLLARELPPPYHSVVVKPVV